MPTAQQKKGHKKKRKSIGPTAQIREALLYVIIKSLRLYNKLTAIKISSTVQQLND